MLEEGTGWASRCWGIQRGLAFGGDASSTPDEPGGLLKAHPTVSSVCLLVKVLDESVSLHALLQVGSTTLHPLLEAEGSWEVLLHEPLHLSGQQQAPLCVCSAHRLLVGLLSCQES